MIFRTYKKLILVWMALMLLSGCLTQKPAPVEDKGKYVFKKNKDKDNFKSTQPDKLEKASAQENQREGANMVEEEIEVKVSTTQPVEDKKLTEFQQTHEAGADKKSAPAIQSANLNNVSSGFLVAQPLGSPKFQWPLDGIVLARYGKTGNKFNEGINIAAPLGTPVLAANDGKVVFIGNNIEGYGNLVIIKHDSNYMTAYAHLNEIEVDRGALVKRGEKIATIGQSGNVSVPQLHFSIRKGKKTINPEIVE